MKLGYAKQYNAPCVILEPGDHASDVIDFATARGAIYQERPEDQFFVVQFPGRPKEPYSERALRRSFPI